MKIYTVVKLSTVLMLLIVVNFIYITLFPTSLGVEDIPRARFYGSGKPGLITILRDIPSSLDSDNYASLYIVGGVPEILIYRNGDDFLHADFAISVNSIDIRNISSKFFDIEVGGFYVKSRYRAVDDVEITVYTSSLYSINSFYTSICINMEMQNIIVLDIQFSKSPTLVDIDVSRLILDIAGIPFGIAITSGSISGAVLNESRLTISVKLSPGQCMNIVFGFNNSVKGIAEKVVDLISYTQNIFASLLSRYPYVEVGSFEVKNLYILSLYNTLNMMYRGVVEDHVIGVYPEELSSYIYLAKLSNTTINTYNLLNMFRENRSFYTALIDYLYLYIDKLDAIPKNILDELLTSIQIFAVSSSRTIDLAKVYRAVDTVQSLSMYLGNSFSLDMINNVRSVALDKLSKLCRATACALSEDEVSITTENVLEGLAIALYGVPNVKKHVDYIAGILKRMDITAIVFDREFAVDAIEVLALNYYEDLAIKVVSAYYRVVLYKGIPCVDFYRVVLRGFLGIKHIFSGVSFIPHIPLALANTSATLYLCSKSFGIRIVNWGSEVETIFLDTYFYPTTVLSCSDLLKYRVATIVLKQKPLVPIYVELAVGGMPLKNSYVELYTSSGFTSSSYTNDNGLATLIAPCGEKYLFIKINNTVISIDTSSWICKEFKLSINIPYTYTESSYQEYPVLSTVKELEIELSETKKSLTTLANIVSKEVYTVSRGLSEVRESVASISKKLGDLYNLIYVFISLSIFSLTIALFTAVRRR